MEVLGLETRAVRAWTPRRRRPRSPTQPRRASAGAWHRGCPPYEAQCPSSQVTSLAAAVTEPLEQPRLPDARFPVDERPALRRPRGALRRPVELRGLVRSADEAGGLSRGRSGRALRSRQASTGPCSSSNREVPQRRHEEAAPEASAPSLRRSRSSPARRRPVAGQRRSSCRRARPDGVPLRRRRRSRPCRC